MEQTDIESLITNAETAREQQRYSEAIGLLNQALMSSAEFNLPEKLLSIFGHKAVVFKHLYEMTGSQIYLEMLQGEAIMGLRIAERFDLTGTLKAALLMRSGDYHMARQEYFQAENLYKQAVSLVDQEKPGEYAEYLSHLAFAEVCNDKPDSLENLKFSYSMAASDESLQSFRRMIVLSGIKLRIAQALSHLNKIDEASIQLKEASTQAESLNSEFKMPMRLRQVDAIKDKLGLK
jgi:tetratricopeptide (TPR) repeat protein